MVTDCSLAVFLWIRVHGRVCMSSLFFPLGCFISSPSRLHYHPDSLMVTGQVNSCRWFYNPWGGSPRQDKSNKQQRTVDRWDRERTDGGRERGDKGQIQASKQRFPSSGCRLLPGVAANGNLRFNKVHRNQRLLTAEVFGASSIFFTPDVSFNASSPVCVLNIVQQICSVSLGTQTFPHLIN